MKIKSEVILDSISDFGYRITSLQLEYPRFIHSEFLTHRVFSRNSSSSRAIPVKKMIDEIRNSPATPIHWGKNKPGMQASEEINDIFCAKELWDEAANNACDIAEKMIEIGLHKQVVNRILEPFQTIRTIVTATNWNNFFNLRINSESDPNIKELATLMKNSLDTSNPIKRNIHVPYISDNENNSLDVLSRMNISAARCARVSYLNHYGNNELESDLELATKLKLNKHASPFEHQAIQIERKNIHKEMKCDNFIGWRSYRNIIYI